MFEVTVVTARRLQREALAPLLCAVDAQLIELDDGFIRFGDCARIHVVRRGDGEGEAEDWESLVGFAPGTVVTFSGPEPDVRARLGSGLLRQFLDFDATSSAALVEGDTLVLRRLGGGALKRLADASQPFEDLVGT